MIIDRIENYCNYKFSNRNISKAIKYILNTDFRNKESGKYELEGDELYYIVNEYRTKSEFETVPELHKKYIDIQYLSEGAERIGYAPYSRQKVFKKYNNENDIAFYKSAMSYITLTKGMFAIINTMELHQPGILLKEPEYVKKIVFKVRDS
ncbi:MAG: YhcH/YjgK/YiaL family protein [Ignavibacteria bacterium]